MHFLGNRTHRLWLLLAALYLTGCASTKPTPSATIPTEKPSVLHERHMSKIAAIQQFSVKGRLGIITKPKNYSAKLIWEHLPEADHIDIYSPIGGKVATIQKTPMKVTLTDNGQKTLEARDAESLTEQTLGFRLPLSGLSHWALGKPSNTGITNMMTWDENGRIKTMQQNGWDIQYKDYAEHAGYVLPRKVTLKNEKMTIKLINDEWSAIQAQ